MQADANFSDYYMSCIGNLKLSAQSSTTPWEMPIIPGPGFDREHDRGCKLAFVVTQHHLRNKLAEYLRAKIRPVLETTNPCAWILVDYVRLGYDDRIKQNNPVVVLVSVKEGQGLQNEAQRTVHVLPEDCRR